MFTIQFACAGLYSVDIAGHVSYHRSQTECVLYALQVISAHPKLQGQATGRREHDEE